MAKYEGRRCSQGAKAPCRAGLPRGGGARNRLSVASERSHVRLERGANGLLVRGYDFYSPPLEVFVMVPFDVCYRGGKRIGVGERPPIELLRPDVVARREVPRFDERACAISFDFPDMPG